MENNNQLSKSNSQTDGSAPTGTVFDQNQLGRLVRKRLCRLCRCGKSQEPFITPCKCQGTNSFVHKRCIETWIEETKQQKCDICRTQFKISIQYRTFFEWLFTEKESSYFWTLIELFFRLLNIWFISFLGIGLIGGYSSMDDVDCADPSLVDMSLSMAITVLPLVRTLLCAYLLFRYSRLSYREYLIWRVNRPQVEVYTNDQFKALANMPTNSFIRVSGFRNIQKYIKQFHDKIVSSTSTNTNSDGSQPANQSSTAAPAPLADNSNNNKDDDNNANDTVKKEQ